MRKAGRDKESVNAIEISGTMIGREAVRYTPAGLEVFEGTFHHRAQLAEAGIARTLEFDFSAVSYAETARKLNGMALGEEIRIKGFLAPRSKKSRHLIVHITEFN